MGIKQSVIRYWNELELGVETYKYNESFFSTTIMFQSILQMDYYSCHVVCSRQDIRSGRKVVQKLQQTGVSEGRLDENKQDREKYLQNQVSVYKESGLKKLKSGENN